MAVFETEWDAMHPEEGPVAAAAARLAEHLGGPPTTAIVLGSGLGVVMERVTVEAEVGFEGLGLPQSTVVGHAGRAITGQLGGQRVVVMSGRVHRYEGHPASVVVRYVRALHRWGVQRLILTNAAGAIRQGLRPGTLALVSDHINLQGDNPLVGPAFAKRFPDMSHAYDPEIRAALRAAADATGVHLDEGVYVGLLGPSYETPAEIRYLRTIGADLVGMSTVPEIIAAGELGLPAAAITLVSNLAAGLGTAALSHEEVTRSAQHAGVDLARLLEVFCAGPS